MLVHGDHEMTGPVCEQVIILIVSHESHQPAMLLPNRLKRLALTICKAQVKVWATDHAAR
jgi:hypothetical protein